MSSSRVLHNPEAWKRLSDNLAKSQSVVKLDQGQEREAWVLTHAFADLEESFRKIPDEYLPELMVPEVEGERVHDLLLDIGEELRHIAAEAQAGLP